LIIRNKIHTDTGKKIHTETGKKLDPGKKIHTETGKKLDPVPGHTKNAKDNVRL
jgi:hypothetical protein